MITTKIFIDPYVSEYITSKYYDENIGSVRFPSKTEIYHIVYDLLSKRPLNTKIETGNLEFSLPDRKCIVGVTAKSPEVYNYLSQKSANIIGKRLKILMWAEIHSLMDENKHSLGIDFKETAYIFLQKYNITSISEDGLLKNYQRWRDSLRRRQKKRAYNKKKA